MLVFELVLEINPPGTQGHYNIRFSTVYLPQDSLGYSHSLFLNWNHDILVDNHILMSTAYIRSQHSSDVPSTHSPVFNMNY